MKKKHILIFLLFFSFSYSQGQYISPSPKEQQDFIPPKKQRKKVREQRWSKSGNFSLQFSPLSVDISPSLFYHITAKLQIGIGCSYIYSRVVQGDSVEHISIYGGRLQVRPRLSQYFFLQAEYEVLNVKNRELIDTNSSRVWLQNPQLGVGTTYPLNGNLRLNMSILYNLNYEEENAPFPSPWRFRFGFNF